MSKEQPVTRHRKPVYAGVCPASYEQLVISLEAWVAAAVAGKNTDLVFPFGKEPHDIVLHAHGDSLDVLFRHTAWPHPGLPESATEVWRSVSLRTLDEHGLQALVTSARRARRRQFGTCRYCQDIVGPGHMWTKDVCQGCASEQYGVVY